jgi:3-oxoacyl-[acyl-carrier-protein] synthase-1
MTTDVHIVALAARTPVGNAAEPTAAAVRSGINRVAEHAWMVDGGGDRLCCGTVPGVEPRLIGADRLVFLGSAILAELAAKLPFRLARTSLLLALPEHRPGHREQDDVAVVRGLTGSGVQPRVVGRGHAGALAGIEQAVESITGGREELCLVGGIDSYLHPDTIDWLDADRRIARVGIRGGFPPGEGAAVVALAGEGLRRRLRMPSLGLVRAVACGHEVREVNQPEGLLGEALAAVYARVSLAMHRPQERFDDIYCDINDERGRTTDYGFALLRCGDLFRDGSRYITPAAQIGDIGAAMAPLNLILATRAWASGYASGKLALISGSSWGGMRAAALLQQGRN